MGALGALIALWSLDHSASGCARTTPLDKRGSPPSRRHTHRHAGAHTDLPAHTQIATLVPSPITGNKKSRRAVSSCVSFVIITFLWCPLTHKYPNIVAIRSFFSPSDPSHSLHVSLPAPRLSIVRREHPPLASHDPFLRYPDSSHVRIHSSLHIFASPDCTVKLRCFLQSVITTSLSRAECRKTRIRASGRRPKQPLLRLSIMTSMTCWLRWW
jgi:hypothetical protein